VTVTGVYAPGTFYPYGPISCQCGKLHGYGSLQVKLYCGECEAMPKAEDRRGDNG
jgi:hypothetical protein